MKTAIYVEQGVTQLVLTPQNDWEKAIIKSMTVGEQKVNIRRASFYQCVGNYVRFDEGDEESLILTTGIKAEPVTTAAKLA